MVVFVSSDSGPHLQIPLVWREDSPTWGDYDKARPLPQSCTRLRGLPDSVVVHARDLFTEAERRRSATYNEGMLLSDTRNSLDVRLNGPGATHVEWALADPVDASGWRSERTRNRWARRTDFFHGL